MKGEEDNQIRATVLFIRIKRKVGQIVDINAMGLSHRTLSILEESGIDTIEELMRLVLDKDKWEKILWKISAKDRERIYKELYSAEWYRGFKETMDVPESSGSIYDAIVHLHHDMEGINVFKEIGRKYYDREEVDIDRIKGTYKLACYDKYGILQLRITINPGRQWIDKFFSFAEAIDWGENYQYYALDIPYNWIAKVTFASNLRTVKTGGVGGELCRLNYCADILKQMIKELYQDKELNHIVQMF